MIVIHVSPTLKHQVAYGEFLKQGCLRLGYRAKVTDDPSAPGDIHVCIGPHYAFLECLGKKTIYIDRCLWGDDFEYVTLGWLRPDGGMIYPRGCDDQRDKPELQEWKDGDKVMYLFDYGPYPEQYKKVKKAYPSASIRPHPATGKPLPPLLEHLEGCKLVIGHRTSALATALINGYPVVSLDSRSCVYPVAGHDILDIKRPDRAQWLKDMSYAQWSRHEIASGAALDYVLDNYNAK